MRIFCFSTRNASGKWMVEAYSIRSGFQLTGRKHNGICRSAGYQSFRQPADRQGEAFLIFQWILNHYLERPRRLAQSGARLIVWDELAVRTTVAEEDAIIGQGAELARREQVYLLMALWVEFPPAKGTRRLSTGWDGFRRFPDGIPRTARCCPMCPLAPSPPSIRFPVIGSDGSELRV
jgi:hypothetical protein